MIVSGKQCIYNRNGKCYFLASAPTSCEICLNFTSANDRLKYVLEVSKPIVTYYDLISHFNEHKKDKKDRKKESIRFLGEGNETQKTLESFTVSEE